MCLYPKLIINRKYTITKKNGGNVPEMHDPRLKYVAVGCGNCIECTKQKANMWRTRMLEELKENRQGVFITLTFSEESLQELTTEMGVTECNAVAGKAVRRFLERVRKETKKSLRHWLITELGHEGTERIHLHGILWTDKPKEWIQEKWQYGNIWLGDYCNEKTINYVMKYVTKIDEKHKNFRGQIFTSAGIGKRYINTYGAEQNKYRGTLTKETYKLNNGCDVSLPIYYRNHIYSEEEREKLWLHRLDKQQRYIMGEKFNLKYEERKMIEFLQEMQKYNTRLGYGSDAEEWKKEQYNITLRAIKKETEKQARNKDYYRHVGQRKRRGTV